MSATYGLVAVTLVAVATLSVGAYGWRFSRTTSDFFVASRSVRPALNASAIGGEYLSAASFLGVAGLVLAFGTDMLWYPVGWTAGYLVLLVLVAAPLRRSGAYTLPDFAEARLESRSVRRLSSLLVVAIGWLYLMPQFQGAGLSLGTVAGTPPWVGGLLVGLVVLVNVFFGGMRSITFVQAFQYWLKLTALLVPVFFLIAVWIGDGAASPADVNTAGLPGDLWAAPLESAQDHALYTTYSIVIATFLGTMGLPHVVVRFYTNPDGRTARRTTLVVLALLGLFYLLPPVYGALGRIYAPDLIAAGATDTVVLELPARMVGGHGRRPALGAHRCRRLRGLPLHLLGADHRGRRRAQPGRDGPPLPRGPSLPGRRGRRRRSAAGARRLGGGCRGRPGRRPGVRGGRIDVLPPAGAGHLVAPADRRRRDRRDARRRRALGRGRGRDPGRRRRRRDGRERCSRQPAAWTVPMAFATMIGVSLRTQHRVPVHVSRTMVRLHTPEAVELDRGPFPL